MGGSAPSKTLAHLKTYTHLQRDTGEDDHIPVTFIIKLSTAEEAMRELAPLRRIQQRWRTLSLPNFATCQVAKVMKDLGLAQRQAYILMEMNMIPRSQPMCLWSVDFRQSEEFTGEHFLDQ